MVTRHFCIGARIVADTVAAASLQQPLHPLQTTRKCVRHQQKLPQRLVVALKVLFPGGYINISPGLQQSSGKTLDSKFLHRAILPATTQEEVMMTAVLSSPQAEAPALLATLDEAMTVLDSFIAKRQELTQVAGVCSEYHTAAQAADRDERQCARHVAELEQRLKSQERQVIFGVVKPGDIPALKTELDSARQALSQHQQTLGDRREAMCTAEFVRADVIADLQRLRDRLAKDLPGLFAMRFGQADPNEGTRGRVVWEERDPTGAAQYRRTWRSRVFHDLFRYVLNLSDDLACFAALRALLTESRFHVRIVSGFLLTRPGGHVVSFTDVGDCVSVPADLSFEDAFEELLRRRVRFLVEPQLEA